MTNAENLGHIFSGILPVIIGLFIGYKIVKSYKKKKVRGELNEKIVRRNKEICKRT